MDALLKKSGFEDNTEHSGEDIDVGTVELMKSMFSGTPLHSILSFSGEELHYEDIQNTIQALNDAE